MAEELGMRMRLDGVVETTSGIALTGAETEKMAKKLDQGSKALDGMGISAKQTRQAMRELPMQFTDIATSLAGGMPAWLVFVQQGGQIRDRFGGAIPALRAIGSLMTPLAVGAGGAAAALGLLTLAYTQTSGQAMEYARAMVLTGNAAGATNSMLQAQAAALAEVAGGQGKYAATLAELVSTGRMGAAQLGLAADAAIRLEKYGGVAIKNTVAAFADLGKDPVKAAAKLNEQTGFLTKAVFDQIEALAKQGRQAEAAALAQNTYASVAMQRTEELKGQLNLLGQAWDWAGSRASKAWDAFANLTRKDTSGERLTSVRAEIDAIMKSTGGQEPGAITASAMRLATLRTQEMILVGQVRAEAEKAQREAAQTNSTRDYIADKLKPPGKDKPKPAELGAIRSANEQYRADFLRSEVKAYDDIAEALAKVAEAEDKRAAEQAASFAAWYANEQAKALLQEQKDAERAAEQARAAWEKTRRDEEDQLQKRRDAIADSIYEGIVNGFREGQTPAEIFIRELKAQFARSVLRIPVEFMSSAMEQASSSIGGALFNLFTGIGGYSTIDPNGMGIPADLPGNPQDRRANGGNARARGLMEVAEEGPELLRVSGRSYLMMGSKDGYVHSASATRAMGGGGRTVTLAPVINIDARTDQAQIRQLVVGAMQTAQADLLQKMDRGEV